MTYDRYYYYVRTPFLICIFHSTRVHIIAYAVLCPGNATNERISASSLQCTTKLYKIHTCLAVKIVQRTYNNNEIVYRKYQKKKYEIVFILFSYTGLFFYFSISQAIRKLYLCIGNFQFWIKKLSTLLRARDVQSAQWYPLNSEITNGTMEKLPSFVSGRLFFCFPYIYDFYSLKQLNMDISS